MGLTRISELLYFVYFFTHIPITLFIDMQAVLPKEWFPTQARQLLEWYCKTYKDSMLMEPPVWYKSFVICEVLLQFPFFFIAAYAFWKGGCKWIRVPAIVYSSHVATTVVAITAQILLGDFTGSKYPGPGTLQERLALFSFYFPYLFVPVVMLFSMLFDPAYQPSRKTKKH